MFLVRILHVLMILLCVLMIILVSNVLRMILKNVKVLVLKKLLVRICVKFYSKATGYDEVSAKLLKLGSESLCQPLTIPFNKCITECIFPTQLKLAIVYPICKKDGTLIKKTYRPVCVVTAISPLRNY